MSIINALIEAANKGANYSDTDYVGEDGLLWCGECKKPKQSRIELLGEIVTVPVACVCSELRYNRLIQEQKTAERQQRVDLLKERGITDSRYKNSVFSLDDRSNEYLSNICHNYVDRFPDMLEKNIGLMLYGESDTGKTFAASCIVNELIERQVTCMIVSCVSLVSGMQENFGKSKNEILSAVSSVKLLVLDDFGVERQTDYVKQTLYEIIDARYRAKLPIIITTNITLDELKNPKDLAIGRIYDRIIEMCTPVLVESKHRRRLFANQKYLQAKELLGV